MCKERLCTKEDTSFELLFCTSSVRICCGLMDRPKRRWQLKVPKGVLLKPGEWHHSAEHKIIQQEINHLPDLKYTQASWGARCETKPDAVNNQGTSLGGSYRTPPFQVRFQWAWITKLFPRFIKLCTQTRYLFPRFDKPCDRVVLFAW